MNVSDGTPDWSPVKRILFRFTFAYLALYILGMFAMIVPWVGQHLFHVRIPAFQPTGSSDTTFEFVRLFCFGVMAAAATLVWTLIDRKRTHHAQLHEGLRDCVRVMLGIAMIVSGTAKVLHDQMPSPTLDRLLQPLGDASPMGLFWTFMGASASYSFFTGAAEMLGGLLLAFRRTTLLGALVCLGVLSNAVMLNFCYDGCAKLVSLHLLAMAVFLILPDLGRLLDLFLLNRRVEPAPVGSDVARSQDRWKALVLPAVIFFAAASLLAGAIRVSGEQVPRPLYGIWEVEEFAVEGEVRPPLVADTIRWRRVIFDAPGTLAIQLMSDSSQRYDLRLDADTQTLALAKRDDPAWQASIQYEQPEPGSLTLEGRFDGCAIRARLHRIDEPPFALKSNTRLIRG
jgi:hypothetical protein